MSTQRAFVIQFLQHPAEPDGFAGRVEHVATGEASHFASPDDLLAFLFRVSGRRAAGASPCAAAASAAAGAATPPTEQAPAARRPSRQPRRATRDP